MADLFGYISDDGPGIPDDKEILTGFIRRGRRRKIWYALGFGIKHFQTKSLRRMGPVGREPAEGKISARFIVRLFAACGR